MNELSDRDIEVLEGLAPMCRDGANLWKTPYELGAGNESHHSKTLRRLWKIGLVEVKLRAYANPAPRGVWPAGGSKHYRLSPVGLDMYLIRNPDWRTVEEYKAFVAEVNTLGRSIRGNA